jgi:type IV secretion system protein VirB11
MNATKILWGQVLLVSATVLAFVWAATEWTAWKLGFQSGLGHPWFEVFGWPVYHPPAFFWWWFAYDAYARDIFVEGAYIAAAGGIAAIVVAVTISVWRAREAKRVTTYGSARWAETREVREAGLLGHDGVLLGRWRDEYLRHDGPEHVLCFAPTRSGKGVGLVVPTLLTWPGSAIVHDIKGENWTLTAGWRARFGRVLIFDPTNAQSAAYNPLLEVRRGEWEVRDVQNIADVLAHHVGVEVHAGSPRVSAELPESGERFEGLVPPVVAAPCFAIRRPAVAVFTLSDYVAAGIMSGDQAELLRIAVAARKNILVAGGTSCGKTTLVNALLAEVAKTGDRVVLIEDTRELQCAAPNLVSLRTKEGAASLSDLVRSSLRLRPDRIPIGEVRGAEALDLLKAWGTGHPGGVGTLHAGSAIGALRRLEQLIQEAVVTVPRALIAETIDVIAVLSLRGAARRLAELATIRGLSPTGDYVLVPAGEN